MSMIASIHGRVVKPPIERVTRTGKAMTIASCAVDVTGHQAEGEQQTLWVSLMAFGDHAEHLAKVKAGESVSAFGRMTRGTWTNHEGETRESWTLMAEALITARSARPGGGRKRGDQGQGHRPHRPEFDDELSF